MVELARARGLRVSFITNGSLLSPENVDRLLRSDAVEKVSISLESADGDTFRAIRGGKLEKVIAGIERLVAERNARRLARPVVGFSARCSAGPRATSAASSICTSASASTAA